MEQKMNVLESLLLDIFRDDLFAYVPYRRGEVSTSPDDMLFPVKLFKIFFMPLPEILYRKLF
jgi:hypothetical protein